MNKPVLKQENPGHQSGLTLIEIMVALVIGSFLMLGAMGLFISNKRVYTEQDVMGRLQENARFAINLLVEDIRMAAYLGCSDDPAMLTNSLSGAATVTNLFNFNNPVEGSENTGGWLPSASTDPVGTSDAITVRYIDPITASVTVSSDMADGSATTVIPVACTTSCATHITVGEPLAISDCASTDIFAVTTVNATSLERTTALSKGYTTASQISRYVTNRYYVATGSNGPSLFRRTYAQDKGDIDTDSNTSEFLLQNQELIEGVENMQIMYGVDNNADLIANSYVTATDVASSGGWNNVVSVKIALLLRTVNEESSNEVDSSTYNLLGTTINPTDDRRRRRVYSTTVQIRNRT